MPRKSWTKDELNKFKELFSLNKYSYREISKIMGRDETSCTAKAFRLKLNSTRNFHRKHSFNENFWAIPNLINSYWAGFFAADGYVCQKPNGSFYVKIELAKTDIEHLEQYKKDVGFSGPILCYDREERNCSTATVTIHSLKWAQDLAKNFNIIPKKTFRLAPPNFILNDYNLSLAYLIGYTDGDGSICFPKNVNVPTIKWVSASEKIISWVHEFVTTNFEGRTNRKRHYRKYDNYWSFSIGGDITYPIKQAMLSLSLPYLHRKWDKIRLPEGNKIQLPNDNQVISDDSYSSSVENNDKIQLSSTPSLV